LGDAGEALLEAAGGDVELLGVDGADGLERVEIGNLRRVLRDEVDVALEGSVARNGRAEHGLGLVGLGVVGLGRRISRRPAVLRCWAASLHRQPGRRTLAALADYAGRVPVTLGL